MIGAFAAIIALSVLSSNVQASSLDDFPESLSEGLGVSIYAAKQILSCLILTSIGLAVAVAARGNEAGSIITAAVMLGAVGMLTVIQWLDVWLIIFLAIIIAFLFASKIRSWMGDQ